MGTTDIELDFSGLKQAVEAASVALMVADRAHRITYINESTRRLLTAHEPELRKHFPGFSVSRIVGSSIDMFHKNPDHQRGLLADPRNLPHDARIRVGPLHFDLRVTAVFDDEGAYVGNTVEWKDVTDAVRAEAERQRLMGELTQLKHAADGASVALMTCDADFNISYANNATMAILRRNEGEIRKVFPGFSANAIVGSNMDQFHKRPEHQRRVLSDPRNLPYKARMSVGNAIFEINVDGVLSEAGRLSGYILEWRDISDQVAAEGALEGLIDAASSGSLDERFDTSATDGFVKQIGDRINTLLEAVARPLADVRRVTDALAEGKLTDSVEREYQGDFGGLALSLNRSIGNLQRMVGQISHSSAEIARAAGEISAGNSNLSSRTQEQAAALEQTAATVEELTSTVKQNAENARHADQLAASARETATAGGKVVTQAVEAMSEINRSSKRIADIIGVIDEIAFQTNLLALNAAVEAARAGDQGRGFAVVATEVRNLAQRSANAAREIKTLIKDSLDKVEDGTRLVDRSGSTLEEIVSGVKKVSDIVAEIAAASDEQASGIEQVNQAVSQMDDATQQNAALVEQAAAAAVAMDDQTKSLRDLLTLFEVSETAAAAATAVAPPPLVAASERAVPVKPESPEAPMVPAALAGGFRAPDAGSQDWDEF